MPNQVSDILKSKAVLWVAPAGETHPDETSVAAGGSWGGNWVQLGYTKEPLSVLYEFDEHEIEVEQVLGAVGRRKINERLTLETVLSEATALNLDRVAGGDGTNPTATAAGPSQVGYEQLDVGDNPLLTEWEIGFEGIKYDATDGSLPVRLFMKGTVAVNGELTFSQKDDDYTGIPVVIKALADTGSSNRMFRWQRVTAAATS